MTRTALPFSAPDLSALARTLEHALADHLRTTGRLPGHVEMMNLLARGAGHRNLQALRAAQPPAPAPATAAMPAAAEPTPAPAPTPDLWFDAPELLDPAVTPTLAALPAPSERVARTLKCFDHSGRLVRWPPKLSQQRLALWVLWTRFDARRAYTEPEVNQVLKAWHTYGDHATLRRELIDHGLMTRKADCSDYRKRVQWPDDEAQGLLRALRRRQAPYRLTLRPPRLLPGVAPAQTAGRDA